MVGCTGVCASTTPTAGTGFILRGCDTWGNADFPLTWSWSGTSGAHILVGVDQTWYNTATCPSSWNRPIFNFGGTMVNGTACATNHYTTQFSGAQYVDFQWLELTGMYWSTDAWGACFGTVGFITASNSDFITFTNSYFHNWTHATSGSGASDADSMLAASGNPGCAHCYFTQNVVNNSDAAPDCATTSNPTLCSGFGNRNWNFTKNICTYVSNCQLSNNLVTESIEVGNNNMSVLSESFNGNHPNAIETLGCVTACTSATYYIHDNYIHNITVAEHLQVGNNNETDYVWNNVIVPTSTVGSNGPHLPQSGTPTAMYFFNNTVANWPACFESSGNGTYTWTGVLLIQNNHCIPASGSGTVSGSPTGGTTTISNNVGMTTATANSQGYTNAETYVYSPISGCTSATCGTVQAGVNLTSTVPAGFVTSDTTYACSQQTISTVVQSVCPARTVNVRPASGAWDAGAYEVVSSGLSTPTCAPGTATYNTGQSVVCSVQSGATGCYTLTGAAPTAPTPGTCGGGSTTYSGAISVTTNAANNLQILATEAGLTNSSVASYTYTFQVHTPTFAPPAGSISANQVITISDATGGSAIFYCFDTTNTCTPATSGTTYTFLAPGYLRAFATLTGYNQSATASGYYSVPSSGITIFARDRIPYR